MSPFGREVADRLAEVRARIDAAGGTGVEVLAVTKGFGPEAIVAAVEAGVTDIGENYAQELVSKLTALRVVDAHPTDLRVHFIGQLQSNKVNAISPFVAVWQSIDRLSLAEALAKRRAGASVMVQVNVSEEPQKGGCAPKDTESVVDRCRALGLDVIGLMTVGRDGDSAACAKGFRWLRACADRLGLAKCSMGMSGDLEVAVAEGSTMVRVGTALFGKRPKTSVQ